MQSIYTQETAGPTMGYTGCTGMINKSTGRWEDGNNTHTLVHDLHGEELPVPAGVAPRADAAAVGHARADGPPSTGEERPRGQPADSRSRVEGGVGVTFMPTVTPHDIFF